MAAIHHATVKRAAKLGLEFAEVDDGFRLIRIEDGAVSVETFESTGAAMEAATDTREPIEWETPSTSRAFCGVMVKGYHDRYSANPHGPGCGDTLDIEMRESVMRIPEGAKEPCVDLVLLRDIAIRHDCWQDRYLSLNPGMQRMNVANRLRGRLRNDAEFAIVWEAGGQPTRCGIHPKAPKAKASRAKAG